MIWFQLYIPIIGVLCLIVGAFAYWKDETMVDPPQFLENTSLFLISVGILTLLFCGTVNILVVGDQRTERAQIIKCDSWSEIGTVLGEMKGKGMSKEEMSVTAIMLDTDDAVLMLAIVQLLYSYDNLSPETFGEVIKESCLTTTL